jgi:hypothetical protein
MLVRGSRCAFFHFGYHMFARLRLLCVVLLFFVFLHRLPPYSYASACLRALGRKLCLLKYVSVLLMCLNAFLSSFRLVSRCTCCFLSDSACFCVLIGLLLFLAIFAYFSPFGVLLAVCVCGCWFLLDYLCF